MKRPSSPRCAGRLRSPDGGRSKRCPERVAEGDASDGFCPACVERRRAAVRSSVPGALVAYCDGSGTTAEETCGSGVAIFDDGVALVEASVHLGNGTNNFAELSAVRVALGLCGTSELRGRHLVVRSDSMYTLNSLMAAYDPHPTAPNTQVITTIRRRMAKRGKVSFEHVKGHSGEPGNERADVLAGDARLNPKRGVYLRRQMEQ